MVVMCPPKTTLIFSSWWYFWTLTSCPCDNTAAYMWYDAIATIQARAIHVSILLCDHHTPPLPLSCTPLCSHKPFLCHDDIKLGWVFSSLLIVKMCVYGVCACAQIFCGHWYECLCSYCFSVVASLRGALKVACSIFKALDAVCY